MENRVGGESRVKREHVAYRLTGMHVATWLDGGRRLRLPCYGKIHEPKKKACPSPLVGDFLSVEWNEARLKSTLSIKAEEGGKKEKREK